MENNNASLPEQKTSPAKSPHSREPLFGVLLLVLMVILIFGFLVGLGWTGYSSWRVVKEKENRPSISGLGQDQKETPSVPKEESKPAETPEKKETPAADQTDILVKAKSTDVSVMNGGAAKGSASTLMDALKKDGYLKVTAGNTLADYTGTVVYFSTGLDKEAEVVKTSILKSYPQTTVKAAIVTNKETTVAPITIILGK